MKLYNLFIKASTPPLTVFIYVFVEVQSMKKVLHFFVSQSMIHLDI